MRAINSETGRSHANCGSATIIFSSSAAPVLPWTMADVGPIAAAALARSVPFLLAVLLLIRLGPAPRVNPEPSPDPVRDPAARSGR